MTKTITAIIGDTQIGSTVGLASPDYTMITKDNTKRHKLTISIAQKWIWKCWNDYWKYVELLLQENEGSRLVVITMGDILEGVHHESSEVIPSQEDQFAMATEIFEPIRHRASKMYSVLGTEAHSGPGSWKEYSLMDTLGSEGIAWELNLDIDGVLMNFEHHTTASRLPWSSVMAKLAANTVIDRALHHEPVPNLIFRAHTHIVDDSGDRIEGVRAISIPSWQLKTTFTHKLGGIKRCDIGGLVVMGKFVDFTKARYKAEPGKGRIVKV